MNTLDPGYSSEADLLRRERRRVGVCVPILRIRGRHSVDKELVVRLLAEGAEVNARNVGAVTPLILAARGKKDVVELLLLRGADINSRYTITGFTPLHWALTWNRPEVAELLLAKGADVNGRDNAGQTPLHCAAGGGLKVVTERLLAKGADVNSQDRERRTPLHYAALYGKTEVAGLEPTMRFST